LPSLVTITEVPVSAMRKLAPVMPTSAARKRSRSMVRASASSEVGSLRVAVGRKVGVDLPEGLLDLRLGEVDGRRDDVARPLVAELDDVLAEVGLDRHDAVLLEMLVEADLLGHHRLALGDGAGARLPADVEDDVAGVLRRLGEVDMAAGGADLLLVGLDVEVEVLERVVLDVPRGVPDRVELRQQPRGGGALGDEADPDMAQRLLEVGVVERVLRVVLERLGMDFHALRPQPVVSPIGGASSVRPASTSATWRTCTGRPSR
jgi:hypothetical protein